MQETISAAELLERGVRMEPPQAVAIVQALVTSDTRTPGPDLDDSAPVSLGDVHLTADGDVHYTRRRPPTVAELATLLNDLLASAVKVPGPLRYVIARGLGIVDAPPFASMERFGDALTRFAPSHRATAVQSVVCGDQARGSGVPDRRRMSRQVTELRRSLREADLRLFEQLQLNEHRADIDEPSSGRRREGASSGRTPPSVARTLWVVIAAMAAVLASGAGGFLAVHLVQGTPVSIAAGQPGPKTDHRVPASKPMPCATRNCSDP